LTRIVFGTDGWRGIIAEDFTFDNVRAVAQALADYLVSKKMHDKGLVVGYDTRFMSDRFAKAVAEVVASNDIQVLLTSKPTPTPIVSFTVRNRKAGGGVVITASHNPSFYNGVKFKLEHGGPAPTEITKQIEGFLFKNEPKHDETKIERNIEEADFESDYVEHVRKLVDLRLVGDMGFNVIFDAMHGAGNRIVERLLSSTKCEVRTIRAELNPSFGGVKPEPIAQNLKPLMETVVRLNADVGFATDGDADRIGVVTAKGSFVTPHEVFALLLLHLYKNRGWRGGVVKTASVCSLVPRMAEKFGLPVYDVAVGFKNICEIMLREDILIGGEESSGLGFKNHVPERDGILSSLFVLELMAMEGESLDQLLAELRREFGELHYDRIDLPYEKPDRMELIPKLQLSPPRQISNLQVEKITTYRGVEAVNGIKFHFTDKRSWLLIRASETEPLIRIYSESTSDKMVQQLLREGLELLKTVTQS
jgi:alpha-D-glucose phosphate-specific phosphoglucomutase